MRQLLTGYGQLMLAEFKYGLEPKETFAGVFGDQSIPRLPYYHLKKDVFPHVYWKYMVRCIVYYLIRVVVAHSTFRSRATGMVRVV